MLTGLPGASGSPRSDYPDLRATKQLLSEGPTDGSIKPFHFRFSDGGSLTAQGSGLEGFVYAEDRIGRLRGRSELHGYLGDYFKYLEALLGSVSWAEDARARIREIQASAAGPMAQYAELMSFVGRYTESLRDKVAASDSARWAKTARIYEIFCRAYNLKGKREAEGGRPQSLQEKRFFADFREKDLRRIRAQGFDTIWVMGIFPIGKRGAMGSAGGSPYSIQDYESIHPDLGTSQEFKAFVSRAHRAGLRVIIDFVINHSSMDSKLLQEHPEFFIGRPAGEGPPPRGFFDIVDARGSRRWIRHGGYDSYGSLAFWEDTAQLDYSNPRLRRKMISIVEGWVRDYQVDGLRVDMAYQILNRYFQRNWKGDEVQMPRREFLEELITEIKGKYPGTAFIAEGYDGWDELSRVGFDSIYGKNTMERPGGHVGWYDALTSRDPAHIRAAIERQAFLHWQEGGSGMLSFIGNHDEAAPLRAMGPWMEGASFLTLLLPGSLLFYGSQEIGFDASNADPNVEGPKSIPFGRPVQVDWKNADPKISRFYRQTFSLAGELKRDAPAPRLEPIAAEGKDWVGYWLRPSKPGRLRAAAILANPSEREAEVRLEDPELGVQYQGSLPAFGYRLIRF